MSAKLVANKDISTGDTITINDVTALKSATVGEPQSIGTTLGEIFMSPSMVPLEPTNLFESAVSLCLSVVFGVLISLIYYRYSRSIMGGRQILSAILPLTITICVIISVVKSSLALSLGLVGALSIVRFRTPIKDPEDLIFLFLAIVAGLGFGANQNVYTAIGVSIVLLIIILRGIFSKRNSALSPADNLNIEIQWATESSINTTILVDKLAELAVHVSLLRFDRSGSFNRLSVQLGLQQNASSEDVVHVLNQVSGLEYQISNAGMDW